MNALVEKLKGKGVGRKPAAILREAAITGVCRGLRLLFDIPRWLTGRKVLHLVELPQGAKVAIIKPCCLGDVALATPVIRALNEARPDLQLDFVVSEWARPVLEHNPRLHTIVATGFEGSKFTLRQYFALALKLRWEKYQAAVVLDRSPLLALLPWLAGVPVRAGLDSRGRGFALNLRSPLKANAPLRHEAEVYLGVGGWGSGVSEFYPGEAAQVSFGRKAQELGIDLGQPLAVIHPGGGHNPDTLVLSKRWPAENFGEIARRLLEQGIQVVLIGAASDRKLVATVERDALGQGEVGRGNPTPTDIGEGKSRSAPTNVMEGRGDPTSTGRPLLFNATERFDIAESGALFERAGLFIGNDTGLMHLAGACGAAVVAVFGPSSPVAYAPYTPKGKAVSPLKQVAPEGLPLSEYQALSAAEGGIMAVTVEQVWEAVESFLPLKNRTQIII